MADSVLTEEKKRKNRTPRAPSKQACLDAMYLWMEHPFADKRDAVFKAMLEHKRLVWGDQSITSL